jgi:hemerythrin superfamily protein
MAGKTRKSANRSAHAADAVALLKADHRQVEGWFAQFSKSRSSARKQQLAAQICAALRVHTEIEEEIFYPAFLSATADKDMHHEAVVEHAGAKELIAQIEEMSAGDDYFDAKVTVLSEMIKHHVKEEEQPGGMFAEAKKSKMDLKALGEELRARKGELQAHDRAA